MKKVYGKIVDGKLQIAPKKLKYNHRWHINPKEEVLIACGYKEVIYDEYPSLEPNQYVTEIYEETEDKIYVSYEIHEWEDTP